MAAKHKSKIRRGLTLLELLLALSLSIVVLMAIGMAINLHYRMFDVRRTNVEEAQLARAVLRHIADDLRCAVQYTPPDLEGLDTVSGNAIGAAANSAFGETGDSGDEGSGGTGNTGSQSGQGGSSGQSTGTSGSGQFATDPSSTASAQQLSQAATATVDPTATDAASTSVVGLYGTATELRFDISRLPRVDEYQSLMVPESGVGVVDIPSDIKTITYFLAEGDIPTGAAFAGTSSTNSTTPSGGRGLMRGQLDRAVAAWAEMNGGSSSAYETAELLAEEVTSLQFNYFDGEGWLPEWDSATMGGLPIAVEIFITIQPTQPLTEDDISASSTSEQLPTEQTYRLVVHLPAARPGANLTETTETTDGTSDASMEAMP